MWICSLSCSTSEDTDTPNENIVSNNNIQVKTFGGSLNDSGKAVIATTDGGYIVLGHTQSADGDIIGKTNTSFDYLLLKFNANSELQWQRTYGGTGNDRGEAIIETTDGGFAVLGFSESEDLDVTANAGASDFWLLKLNASGEVLWQNTYGFQGADTGMALVQTNDGGFLITGSLDVSSSLGEGNAGKTRSAKRHAGGNYWAIKTDPSGQREWSRFYGGSFTDTPTDIIQSEDNGYIVVGSSDSNDLDITGNKGSYDFWVLKLSSTGELLWQRSYGGSQIDQAHSISIANDGNYLIAGDTRSNDQDVANNNGAADVFLVKIRPNGNLIWQKTFGGSGFDAARSIIKDRTGGFLIAGSSRSLDGDLSKNNGQNDAWILKINADGDLEWQDAIGGANIDLAFSAAQLNNNTVVIVGETSSADIDIQQNKGFTDVLLLKLN